MSEERGSKQPRLSLTPLFLEKAIHLHPYCQIRGSQPPLPPSLCKRRVQTMLIILQQLQLLIKWVVLSHWT